MSLKVLIERHVEKGKEGQLIELLNKLRNELIAQPSYISGELLQSQQDKTAIFALSTWQSELDWQPWEGDPKFESKIESLLSAPSKLTEATPF